MALINCHECGSKVSDHAKTCPQCGAPVIATIKRRQKAFLIDTAVRLALAVVIGVILWFGLHHIFNQAMASLRTIQQKQQTSH